MVVVRKGRRQDVVAELMKIYPHTHVETKGPVVRLIGDKTPSRVYVYASFQGPNCVLLRDYEGKTVRKLRDLGLVY